MLPGKKITPAEILQMLRRRVWLIAIPPLVTLFVALLYSSTIGNLYQSNMLIAIVPQRVPDQIVRSTVTLRTDERLDAITVQVQSRTNLQKLIEELDLYPEERAAMAMEDVIDRMRGDLDVGLEPVRRGPRGPEPPHAFHIRYTHPNAKTATLVTGRVGTMYVEQNARDRGALADATSEFLEGELAGSRERLVAQERKLEAFRQRHGNELPTQLQTNMQAIQSKQMQVQAIVEAMARDRDRKLVLERLYRDAASEPAPVTVTQTVPGTTVPVNASAQQQLEAARADLAGLERKYTADHPDVARARRQVASLEPKAAAERAAAERAAATTGAQPEVPITGGDPTRRERLREMAAEIESLDRQTAFKESEERRVRAEITEYQRRVEAVPGVESEWVALSRDYDTQQERYRELLGKSETAKIAANLEERQIGEQFRIVDPANVPIRPVASSRLTINGAGLAIGLAFGLGLALFLELRDSSFRSDGDVLDVLALPVLASVPRIVATDELARQVRRRRLLSAAGVVCVAAAGYVTWSLKLWNSLI